MRVLAKGQINKRIHIAGHPIFPGYIIQGGRRNLMVEAGLNILGPDYLEAAKTFLGKTANLDFLLVTHGHYDHIGSLSYLKRKIPNLELRAHQLTAELLNKERIVKIMNFLSQQACNYFEELHTRAHVADAIEIRPFQFGTPLHEGDVIDLGDYTCEALETPGHTRDHLSFFLPELGLLFPGEALGNPIMQTEGVVKIEFLSSYNDYLNSIQKLMTLLPHVNVLAMSHLYYYTGEDVPRFMGMALRDTFRYRELIERYLDMEHGDSEKAASTMLRVEYDEKGAVYQERNAYAKNLTAQVNVIAALRG